MRSVQYLLTDKKRLDVSDEEEHLQPITLTRQHKGAIRAIRKVTINYKSIFQYIYIVLGSVL